MHSTIGQFSSGAASVPIVPTMLDASVTRPIAGEDGSSSEADGSAPFSSSDILLIWAHDSHLYCTYTI